MIPNVPEPWCQMQNHANHKGSIGDFAKASLTQCNLDCNCDNLTSLTQWNIAKLNFLMKFVPEQALFHVKILGTSLEHGSGTPKWPRPLFPFAGERFYCRFGESSSRKDETQFLRSIFVKKNRLKSSSKPIWLASLKIR